MKVCFKDKDRACDDNCEAYCADERHGTNCLELASQVEVSNRMQHLICSNDLNSFFMKVVAQAMSSFQDTLQGAMG